MSSNLDALRNVKSLTPMQKAALAKNSFKEISDVVLTPPSEIARKLRTSLSEAQSIIENVSREYAKNSIPVDRIRDVMEEKLTTGDAALDKVIGGGIRTGMVWELAGESASGKTQLALQLCLLVQLRPMLGGLLGSACYLSTHAKLATKRLSQLIEDHPLLSPSVCNLSDIHTVAVPTIELLIRTLAVTFPALQAELRNDSSRKPVKLVIIDSISALFHISGKPSSSTLFERSRALSKLSLIIHKLAAKHKIAFVVINEVTDVFNDYYFGSQEGLSKGDIVYRSQSKWFGSAHSIPAESAKEACLGLVWANQLNARIMLTRTNRRRYIAGPFPSAKRRHIEGGSNTRIAPQDDGESDDAAGQYTILRRFTVVFSSVSAPGSADFIVTNAGVSSVHDENAKVIASDAEVHSSRERAAIKATQLPTGQPPDEPQSPHITDDQPSQQFVNARAISGATGRSLPSETGNDSLDVIPSTYPEVDEFDDEDRYLDDLDELPVDVLLDIDFDGLERSQIEDTRVSQTIISPAVDG